MKVSSETKIDAKHMSSFEIFCVCGEHPKAGM